MSASLYARGHRDGERGLEPARFDDHLAHDLYQNHALFHVEGVHLKDTDEACSLDCAGLADVPEETRKRRRQLPEGLPTTHHTCPVCGAIFRTENRAAERAEYTAGYEAGRSMYARRMQQKRNDQQRRAHRRRR